MTQIIFNSFNALYNYYYQIGKDWTSPNQALPQNGAACLIKIEKGDDEPSIIKGFYSLEGWMDHTGAKIEQSWTLQIIEWKYAKKDQPQSACQIL